VTCASLHPIDGGSEQFCKLGGSLCDELTGMVDDLACDNRREICASQVVCQCNDNGSVDIGCVGDKIRLQPPVATRILCSIGFDKDASNPVELRPCGQETLDRAPLPTTATECGVRLAELAVPAQLNDFVKIVNGPLELKLFPRQDGCSYGLGWGGALPSQPDGVDPPSFFGLTEIVTGGRTSLVTLEVHFLADGTCPRDTCIVVPATDGAADNVFGCLE
jgi:hypothetical protein